MKKKKILIVIFTFPAVIFLLGGILITTTLFSIKDYLDHVPEVIPNPSITAECGDTLTVSDLCQIECEGNYYPKIYMNDTQIADAMVSEDKQSIYVGSSAGVITVEISASGENAESSGATAKIYVGIGLD